MNALMIMCHKNPKQVIRLASKCHTYNTDIIIHCDSAMNDTDFSLIKEFCDKNEGVYLTDKRIHGELCYRTLIDAEMIMINVAHKIEESYNKHYNYYLLCSGQDYPIKPIDYIEKQLESVYPKPFIDCTPYDDKNWLKYKFSTNIIVFKYRKWITNNFKKGLIRSVLRVSEIILSEILKFLHATPYYYYKKRGVELYGGSQWWILPDRIIEYITKEYNSKSELCEKILDETYIPDEAFFQIMTMRSPIKDMVEINPVNMVAQNCKTFAYFSDVDKPFKGHPYIFTKNEFERIKNSEFWFARKFDESVDTDIMDMIDKEILEKN